MNANIKLPKTQFHIYTCRRSYPTIKSLKIMDVCMFNRDRPFPLKYPKYRVINKTKLCECPFSAVLYYLVQMVLSYQNNGTATDSLCSALYLLKLFIRSHLTQKWRRHRRYLLQMSHYIIYYVKISKLLRPLSTYTLYKNSRPIQDEL